MNVSPCYYLLASISAYIIGSLPTGYWFARLFFNIDITKHGSGNIGATNVARVTGNKKYFLLIFFLDALKAYFFLAIVFKHTPFCLYFPFVPEHGMIFSVILLIGNGYSLFLNFKGGKGVSTAFGILAFLMPFWFKVHLCLTLFFLALTRGRVDMSVLSSIVLTALASLILRPGFYNQFFLIFLAGWLLFRHRDNIQRFQEG